MRISNEKWLPIYYPNHREIITKITIKKAILYYLNEEPRTDESQIAVLTIEPIVVSVERKVVQIEKPGTES